MQLANIEIAFENYLRQKESYYALLVNGNWGSGKTFFWKNTLEPKANALGFKSIYISLNGISKIDSLEHLMFIKLIPFISKHDNSKIKNAIAFLTNLANQLAKSHLKSSLNDLFKGVSTDIFDFSKHVICFDDLERCKIPTVEILGFINNYVEHRQVKTIILADESHILSDYGGVKEKVIGRVLNFQLDIQNVLPHLFSKYQFNEAFHKFLTDYTTQISTLLVEFKMSNLRVVKFYLDALESFYPALVECELESLNKILRFTAAITLEFKNGKLQSTDYLDYKGLNKVDESYFIRLRYELAKENTSPEAKKSYVDDFCERYYREYNSEFCFYSSIYSYLLSGYLDMPALQLEVVKNKAQIPAREKVVFNKLLSFHFRHLENDEFQNLTVEVLKFAREGIYSIYDYASIANCYYFFSDNKLIKESISELDSILYTGISKASERGEIQKYALENLLHFSDDDARVTDIKKEIEKVHKLIDKKMKSGKNDELVNSITSSNIDKMLDVFRDYNLSDELFIHTDSVALFEAIKLASNEQLAIFERQLQSRYKFSNIGQFLANDISILNSLHDDLVNYINITDNIGQPRLFVFQSLIAKLREVSDHLEATKK